MTAIAEPKKVYSVQESAARFDNGTRVDRENKIIRDVVVLGHVSENGRRYSRAVMEEALGLYDQAPVKIDHPPLDEARSTRPFDTTWGWLEKPRVVMENGEPKIRADLRYLESHPSTATILERIEHYPNKLGLSHNADVDGSWDGTVFDVSAILEVRSADIVENPATTRGIFESRNPSGGQPVATKQTRKMKLRGILEGSDYLAGKPASISGKAVVEMMDEAEAGAEVLDLEMDMEDAGSPEDGVKAGIRMAIMAVLDDESLSAEDLVNRIRELLAAREAASGGGEAATEQEEEEEMPPTEATESKGRPHRGGKADSELLKRMAALESKLAKSEAEKAQAVLESKCREMLGKKGVEATSTRVAAMARCTNDAERVALLNDWPSRADTTRPERSPSMLAVESTTDFSKVDYTDPTVMAKALR